MSDKNGKAAEPEAPKSERKAPAPMDAELKAMGRVNRIMTELADDDARRRVAAWVCDRWEFPILRHNLLAQTKHDGPRS